MAYTGSYKRQDIQTVASNSGVWEVAWKGYFFVMTAVYLILPFVVPPVFLNISIMFFVQLALSLIGFIGIFGFAWKERIFTQLFWKILWVVVILQCIVSLFIPTPPEMVEAIQEHLVQTIVISIVLLLAHIPGWIALILYAFRAKDIWQQPAPIPDAKAKK